MLLLWHCLSGNPTPHDFILKGERVGVGLEGEESEVLLEWRSEVEWACFFSPPRVAKSLFALFPFNLRAHIQPPHIQLEVSKTTKGCGWVQGGGELALWPALVSSHLQLCRSSYAGIQISWLERGQGWKVRMNSKITSHLSHLQAMDRSLLRRVLWAALIEGLQRDSVAIWEPTAILPTPNIKKIMRSKPRNLWILLICFLFFESLCCTWNMFSRWPSPRTSPNLPVTVSKAMI